MPRVPLNQAEVMAEIFQREVPPRAFRPERAIALAIVLLADNVIRGAHIIAGSYDPAKDDRRPEYNGPDGDGADVPPIDPRQYGLTESGRYTKPAPTVRDLGDPAYQPRPDIR